MVHSQQSWVSITLCTHWEEEVQFYEGSITDVWYWKTPRLPTRMRGWTRRLAPLPGGQAQEEESLGSLASSYLMKALLWPTVGNCGTALCTARWGLPLKSFTRSTTRKAVSSSSLTFSIRGNSPGERAGRRWHRPSLMAALVAKPPRGMASALERVKSKVKVKDPKWGQNSY